MATECHHHRVMPRCNICEKEKMDESRQELLEAMDVTDKRINAAEALLREVYDEIEPVWPGGWKRLELRRKIEAFLGKGGRI